MGLLFGLNSLQISALWAVCLHHLFHEVAWWRHHGCTLAFSLCVFMR
jgi:hypothetical protein